MKIGIIGSGEVGQALAAGFADAGHTVMLGSRQPTSPKLHAWKEKADSTISLGDFAQTAQFGEMMVIATLGTAVAEAIKLAGLPHFSNKIVIDVTNPLDFSQGMPPRLAKQDLPSNGEVIQALLPDSKVVKTLNIIGNPSMYKPQFEQGEPDMFLCGNDEVAKQKVTEVLVSFGWKNITDLGDISHAYMMEVLCLVWVAYGVKHNTWHLALKFLTQ